MSNINDFFGGGGSPTFEFGDKKESMSHLGILSESEDLWTKAKKFESMSQEHLNFVAPLEEDATKYLYTASSHLSIGDNLTSSSSFLGIKANTIEFSSNPRLTVSPTGQHFSRLHGNQSTTQNMLLSFPFSLRGGNGAGATSGGTGGAWYGASGNYTGTGANGGGCIFLVADTITGFATLDARGGSGYKASGGGGMILILTKSWEAKITLDVTAKTNNGYTGQVGSYAIFKINEDESLTLMVHSQNGTSEDLYGQTPVYGDDASIAW